MCDRSIFEQLCDWCELQKAIGWSCHSHYVTPCRSLRVRRSLQHQEKSEFCQLFLIESRFTNNFATVIIDIKFPKQHSVLSVPYWPQTFTWESSIIFWVGLTVKTVPLLLKIRSRDYARSLLQTTQGRSEPSCLHFASQKKYKFGCFGWMQKGVTNPRT
jgi:hypothetical protein